MEGFGFVEGVDLEVFVVGGHQLVGGGFPPTVSLNRRVNEHSNK